MTGCCLLVGASRGIGFALGRRYAQAGWSVISVARSKPASQEHLKRHIVCDVSTASGVDHLTRELADVQIDLLVYLAAIVADDESFQAVTPDEMHNIFAINAFAPFFVTRSLLPNLEKASAAKVVFVTSLMGSIADNSGGNYYIYRASKAALHQFGKTLSIEFAKLPAPIPVLLIHPGMVRTEYVEARHKPLPPGLVEPSYCAEKLFGIIDALDMSKTGTLVHREGQPLPW